MLSASGLAFADQVLSTEQGGIAVELSLNQQAQSGFSEVNLRLRDATSGELIKSARPAAWMLARRSEQVANELSCEDKANQLSQGSLGTKADVDMNNYRLITLNQDNTIAFINPMVSLKNSKLESIVQLPDQGFDWLIMPHLKKLVVSLRNSNQVALVDTVSRKISSTIQFAQGSLPTRIMKDLDEKSVWLGLDGMPQIALLDTETAQEIKRLTVGQGLHTFAADTQGQWVFVTNSQDNTVTLIDRKSQVVMANVTVGHTPVFADWSEAAQKLVVLSANAGELSLLDPKQLKQSATLKLSKGITSMRLFDHGRRALIINPIAGEINLVDLATLRLVDTIYASNQPDQIVLAGDFAYIRGLSNSLVHIISLKQANTGKLQSTTVPIGKSAPLDKPEAINDAAVTMVAPPEANGMLMANAPDGYIYRYVEGMMAPIGSFSNYRREARALMVLDDSLTERLPGNYQATVRIPKSGNYDIIVRNLSPAITACFTKSFSNIAQTESIQPPAPTVSLLEAKEIDKGQIQLVFSVKNKSGAILQIPDLIVLGFLQHGNWQQRAYARPKADGNYEVRLATPTSGTIQLLVQSSSQNLAFTEGHLGNIQVPLVSSTFNAPHAALREGAYAP